MKKTSFPKSDIQVTLLEGIHPRAAALFHQHGYTQIQSFDRALSDHELRQVLDKTHILGIRSRTQLNAEVLNAAPKLMALGCFCIGTNQVDLQAAAQHAVPVFNAPYSNTRSVAEMVLAETIMLMRGIPAKNVLCHRGGWTKSAAGSFEVRGKTIGIIGYGHIGTQVGVLAENLGMQVLFHDVETKLALGNAHAADSLVDLLQRADVVTLHVPETASTQMMIGAAELALMKKGGILINAARGTVLDIDALAQAILSEHIGGAAVDVFPVEPSANQDEFISPLRGLDNVILTPHIGGSTLEAQENIGLEVAAKLIRYSDNGSTLSAVNFPEVSLPVHPGSHRLLHIHHNMPGMLSKINDLFRDSKVNIDGQYLQTTGNIGYVVIDLSASGQEAAQLHDAMREIDGTIRTRILF